MDFMNKREVFPSKSDDSSLNLGTLPSSWPFSSRPSKLHSKLLRAPLSALGALQRFDALAGPARVFFFLPGCGGTFFGGPSAAPGSAEGLRCLSFRPFSGDILGRDEHAISRVNRCCAESAVYCVLG